MTRLARVLTVLICFIVPFVGASLPQIHAMPLGDLQPKPAAGVTASASASPSSVTSLEVEKVEESPKMAGSSALRRSRKPRREPNPVVIPPYRAQIRAAHRVHAEQAKMICTDCHENATRSNLARDFLGPKRAVCERCHEVRHDNIQDPSLERPDCERCHLTSISGDQTLIARADAPRHPAARLNFSHGKHAKRNIGCGICHPAVSRQSDANGAERLPLKTTCVNCHRGDARSDGDARSTCVTCHESESGRMRTRFGDKRLLPVHSSPAMEHGANFRLTHGTIAGNDPSACKACHSERECQRCHDGRLRPRQIHPSDYLSMHAIAAKQEGGCESCHRAQTFCLSCHQRAGVVSSGTPRAMAQRGSMHPPAEIWTNGPKGARHHGTLARRNLYECVSCHQERDCIRCHSASNGVGGNAHSYGSSMSPHPGGFVRNCRDAWQRNPRPCLACHRPEGLEIQRCH